jgi:hypothetical protein
MNMKTLTQFLILCASITLTLNSCSKKYYQCEPLAEEDSRWPYNITAEWQQENVNFDFNITSDTDQLAVDFLTPSEDSLVAQFSVGTATSLKYLQASLGDTNIILAQNQSIGGAQYPLHELVIVYYEVADSGAAVYSISQDNSGVSEDFSNFIGFTFNPLDYSLTLSEQILYNTDSTQTVTLGGTINIESTQLFSDNPVSVPLSFSQTTTTIILNPGGEYFRLTDDGSGVPDEAEGTWEVTDTSENVIKIIETYDNFETGETVTDTLSILYSLESDTLTFSQEKNPCESYADENECFEQFELNFGLAENSITDLGLTSTMAFTKSSAGKRRQLTSKQPAYWFGRSNFFKDLHSKR